MNKIFILVISIQLILTNSIYSQNKLEELLGIKKNEVVENEIEKKTKKCTKYSGLFNFYQEKGNGNSYIEIDTSHIGKEFIHFCYIENYYRYKNKKPEYTICWCST